MISHLNACTSYIKFVNMQSSVLAIVILCIQCAYALFDPISLSIGAGVLAGLGYNFNFVKDNTYCKFSECCNADYIPGNINKLEQALKSNLFGQHIVIQQLVPALRAHFSEDAKSKKALVLSFHGTQGTGKNFVADFIAESLYKNGLKSKFVHKYGRGDFPEKSKSYDYRVRITSEVKAAIADCPRSLFIFDEVDKIPPGVFESITSLVDYASHINGVDYSHAIFIFLSNTAGVDISSRLGNLMASGTLRDNTKMSDFEKILELGAYNAHGGLEKSSLIEAYVVDHYIPFLPLEKVHVVQCLEAEFKRWRKYPNPDVIENMIKELISFEKVTGLFATSGCKQLEKKVAAEVKS